MHEAEKEKLKSQKICNSHANQHHGSAADLPLNKDESTTQVIIFLSQFKFLGFMSIVYYL